MARCLSPFVKKGENIPLPCGKCISCKKTRASHWSFRLQKEAEQHYSAFFITLTYQDTPITPNGFMTLKKEDFQKFMKRLRKHHEEKIVYYAVGEYGGKTKRPHYHAVIFNCEREKVYKAWTKGHIHIGEVNAKSVGYTLKYISKEKSYKHERDDRESEFSLMSKGIGKNYLSDAMRKWHKQDVENRMYCTAPGGIKVSMPRYYREKLYTKRERLKIANNMQEKHLQDIMKGTYQQYKERMDYQDLIDIEKMRKVVTRNEKL